MGDDMKIFEQLNKSNKRGCPTCDGIDPKTCMRCLGKTRLSDWYRTDNGWMTFAKIQIMIGEKEAPKEGG